MTSSLRVKEFWTDPLSLVHWEKSSFGKPYTITVRLSRTAFKAYVGLHPAYDGPNGTLQLMGIVTEANMNAFNKAKTTISIVKTVNLCD